jgi:hypothetical protein
MPTSPPDDDDLRDMQALAATEEGRRLLRPGLLKFLSSVGITPQVDATTGELVVDFPAVCAALGIDPAEEAEQVQGHLRMVPSDRLKPVQ